jgi:RNA polymerase sigma factor FliA
MEQDILALLAQRMAKLPIVTKKVLAMYHHEKMRHLDIAACFGSTESRICHIHNQAIASLRTFFYRVKVEEKP